MLGTAESEEAGVALEAEAQVESQAQAAAEGDARRRFGQLPLRYEENRGQHDARARYVARQGGLTLFATDEGPVLALRVPEAPMAGAAAPEALEATRPGMRPDEGAPGPGEAPEEPARSRVHGLRIALEGARSGVAIEPSEPLVTRSNYFIGDDPSEWRTDIPNYGALTYRELAPGVDLVLHGSPEGRLEYDFVVAPGTAPELAVRFEGAERVTLGEGGALEVHLGGAVLEQPAPVLYQDVGGERVRVEGGYRVVGLDRVRFEVGEYDRSRPLVIDPVLVYGTYLGGSGADVAYGIAVDAAGAAYVAGLTGSTNFPTASPYQSVNGGGDDAFVAKLTAAGDALAYATYLGGSNTDYAYGIAVDVAGAAYVAGRTSSTDFPTASPYQSASGGGTDAFIAKLTPAGDALAYATYLGDSGADVARGIGVDAAGAAYVAGSTTSTNFPTVSPYQSANGGGADVFVAKLTPAGDALAYATYLGGSGNDYAHGIAVDAAGAAYVAGQTDSTNFPTASPYQSAFGGYRDAFVAKLTPAGDALAYATYLGGSDQDVARAIGVDAAGAAYVAGWTHSTNFPTASPYQSEGDAFVAKLTPAGDALAYATYLGGSSRDAPHGIAVDAAGAAYVVGQTFSTDFPTVSPYQSANGGGLDAFVAKLTPAGDALAYATYLGGSSYEDAFGIAVDAAGAAYVAGETGSTNFPTARPYQSASSGGGDAFVAKLDPTADGASCTADAGCASGFCTDGRCCDLRCGGGTSDCQACSVAAGAATDGACGPTTGNTCEDGLACTTGTTCSAGACGSPRCDAATTCSEAGGGAYTCSACPAGTYSADGTGASACTPCAAGTWSAAGATSCAAWSDCAAGTYISTAGTATNDRTCTACAAGNYSSSTNATSCSTWSDCPAGTYVSSEGNATSDRVCTMCATGTYSTSSNATSCTTWSDCAAGTYISTAGAATNDRTCTACASGSYSSSTNATSCTTWSDCAAGTYVSSAGTATTDRVCTACAAGTYSSSTNVTSCSAWSDCAAGTYVSSAGTATSDRACEACAAGRYSSSTNASACAAWSECAPGTYVSMDGSATSDRTCTPCASGTYAAAANEPACAPWTTCTAEEYESVAPSASNDRQCAALTVCADGEYETAPPTATSDRACAACTDCAPDEVEVSACTATADAVCEAIADGGRPDAGMTGDAGTVAPRDAGADAGTDPPMAGGCGCTVPTRSDGSPFGLALLSLLGLAARRRR